MAKATLMKFYCMRIEDFYLISMGEFWGLFDAAKAIKNGGNDAAPQDPEDRRQWVMEQAAKAAEKIAAEMASGK